MNTESGATTAMLANISVVLVRPKHPENIGAAARVMANMGIAGGLVVVRDEMPDREKMLMMATHKAARLIDEISYYRDLASALEPFAFVVGSSARQGRKRRIENSPGQMIETLLPLLPANRVALLFGPEDRGLTNDDLKYCQLTVTIPTAAFSSLNLAQSVAILCYETYVGLSGVDQKAPGLPRLADSREMNGMYEHIELLLQRIGFLKTRDYEYWMRNIRKFLGRKELRAKEARLVRGFCRQFIWYDNKLRQKDGAADAD